MDRVSVVQLDSGRVRFKVRIRKIHRRCVPWNGDTVDVSTATGYFQTDATQYSMDRLRLGVF